MNTIDMILQRILTHGSKSCGVFCGLIGIVIAVLLLTIGLWKTLFIAVFAVVGYFLGRVGNKKEFFKKSINEKFPPKDEI